MATNCDDHGHPCPVRYYGKDRVARWHRWFKRDFGRLAKMKNANSEQPAQAVPCRRLYKKPEVRSERVFEVQALACGKVFATQGGCRFSRKTS
jgi:hypothetical protein